MSEGRLPPDFSNAEDAGIMQYVQTHRGRQNWDECLKALTEQGIIAPGARTAKQLMRRFNYLKRRLGDENYSDSASEEEESL